MAFTWIPITAGTTKLEKAQMQEIIENIITVETNLDMGNGNPIPRYSWEPGYYPFELEKVDLNNLKKVRLAVENIENANKCFEFCGTNNTSYLDAHLTVQNGNNLTGYLSGHNATYKSGYDNRY